MANRHSTKLLLYYLFFILLTEVLCDKESLITNKWMDMQSLSLISIIVYVTSTSETKGWKKVNNNDLHYSDLNVSRKEKAWFHQPCCLGKLDQKLRYIDHWHPGTFYLPSLSIFSEHQQVEDLMSAAASNILRLFLPSWYQQ